MSRADHCISAHSVAIVNLLASGVGAVSVSLDITAGISPRQQGLTEKSKAGTLLCLIMNIGGHCLQTGVLFNQPASLLSYAMLRMNRFVL